MEDPVRARCSSTTTSAGKSRRAALFAAAGLLLATSVAADVCIWRDPERTMQRIFPQARDYKTLTVKMTPEAIAGIERALGQPLDESETHEFNFYEIIGSPSGKPQVLGTIIALAGKGEYGVIEVVIGVDARGKVVGAYVQRSRERATKAIQEQAFLKQFAGKGKDDGFEVGQDIRVPSPAAEAATKVVALVIRKMLVFCDVLTKGRVTK